MAKIAALDIGTNSLLLLVAETGEGEPVRIIEEIREPRLGASFNENGNISESAVERAKSALKELVRIARDAGAEEFAAFGTRIFRSAANGRDVAERLSEIVPGGIEIITPEREAELAFLGASRSLEVPGKLAVLDVGGGSSEISFGESEPEISRSFPVGAVVLTEECGAVPPVSDRAARCMESRMGKLIRLPQVEGDFTLVGVGGTITTLAAMQLGLRKYEPERVHGTVISARRIAEYGELFRKICLRELRERIPFAKKRAEILPAGAAIFAWIAARLNSREVWISDRGPRWGAVISAAGELKK